MAPTAALIGFGAVGGAVARLTEENPRSGRIVPLSLVRALRSLSETVSAGA